MNKDTLQINDTEYRVEINMNTAEAWEKMSGKKLGQFEIEAAESAQKGGVATRAMLLWLYCAIIEGEELEGRAFELDFIEFKRMLKPAVLSKFAPIFIKQYIGESYDEKAKEPQKEPEEVKKKTKIRLLFLSCVRSPWAKWVIRLVILSCVALYFFGMRHKG